MPPLVSILIPVYNCEPYLDKCITSIINQDYKNIQIVLANDGSTDNSLEICRNYANDDSRISVLTRGNMGVANTRNDLLEQIKGEYFLFVDADDWIEPDMVSYLLGLINEFKADIAVCSNVNGNPQEEISIEIWNQNQTIEKFLYHKEMNGSLWNKLIKSSLIKDIKFDPEVHYGEDALFLWSLLLNTSKISISNKQLYHYRMNPSSLSHSLFGSKKLTANKVWQNICKDAEIRFPSLAPTGKARWGMEMTQLLFYASKTGKGFDKDISDLQTIVKKFFPLMKRHRITSPKGLLFAWFVSHYYTLSKLFSKYIYSRF